MLRVAGDLGGDELAKVADRAAGQRGGGGGAGGQAAAELAGGEVDDLLGEVARGGPLAADRRDEALWTVVAGVVVVLPGAVVDGVAVDGVVVTGAALNGSTGKPWSFFTAS